MLKLGFRNRLLAAIALLILAMASFFALYVPRQQEQAADAALRVHAEAIAKTLVGTAGAAIVTEELGGADALSEDLERVFAADQQVIYATISRQDGSVLSSSSREGYQAVSPFASSSPGLQFETNSSGLHVSIPIEHDGARVGSLTVGFRRDEVLTARSESQRSAWLTSAVMLVLGIGVAWLIGRSVVNPVLNAVSRLQEVSSTLVELSREQEASSAEEAAVVAQTRQSMETLLESAQSIADQSSEVLGNAERSASGSSHVVTHFRELNRQNEKVAEILGSIMQIADKADLLALNASLEGTRAGDAGKGFILVAAEMRRLAESVMESIGGIRQLMTDMEAASQGAANASSEGHAASKDTAESARNIALLTQEQRQATEQVIASMNEMSNVLRQSMAGVKRSNDAARSLVELSSTLSDIVNSRSMQSSTPQE